MQDPNWQQICQGCGTDGEELWYLPQSGKRVCKKCYTWCMKHVEDQSEEEQQVERQQQKER